MALATAMLIALPLMSAAANSLTAPVENGNYTGTVTVTAAISSNGANNMTNVTCYYNDGGAPNTVLVQILNTSASQTSFTNSVDVSTFTDSKSYNMSCRIMNYTTLNSTFTLQRITIDNTNPVVTMSADVTQVSEKRGITFTWTSFDSTAGLSSQTVTVVSPDTGRCPTQTFSTTGNSSTVYVDEETVCPGYYNATVTSTDYPGNTATKYVQVRVTAPDGKFVGAKSIAPISEKSNKNTIIIVAAIIIIVMALYSRKK